MKGCLSQRDMADFVGASASAEELAGWKRHLRICDRCAEAVARMRAGLAPAVEPAPAAPANAEDANATVVGLEPNLQIGDFRLERRLGSGGMGVVYQAVQVSLNRRVALKVLPLSLAGTGSAIERFHREARAAAKLRHPNLVTIYAEGADGNVCYFAMEMIDGRNLDQVIADLREAKSAKPPASAAPCTDSIDSQADVETEGWPETGYILQACASDSDYFNAVARLIGEVADALHYAHGQGIIHRDVKPSNFMLTRDGRLILLDFGIARICQEHAVTLTSSFIGTPRYMSPEQIAGAPDKVDHRADIYSLGVTLYELLTLEPLFDGDTQQQVIGQILGREPRRPRHINRAIPADLETICCKAIDKDPDQRYQSAGEFAEDLHRYLGRQVIKARRAGATDRLVKLVRRRTAIVVLAAGIVVAVAFAATITWRHYTMLWAQRHALAEIDGLIETGNYLHALVLAEKAERFIPDDPLLVSRWPRLSRQCTIITNPLGAKVYIGGYPDKGRWKYLGRSPIEKARVPFGTYRWRVERPGFTSVEVVRSNDLPSPSVDPATLTAGHMSFSLHRKVQFPPDMVWIPPAEMTQHEVFHGRRRLPPAGAFLIDKYEVTNRRYKAFMSDGGYEKPELWQEPFIKDGRVLTWEQARETFRDQTGDYGPAGWKNGTYPPGQADYPVGGLSWYEAAAYARSCGKDLPTIFHWLLAARGNDVPCRIAHYSNFDKTPAPVGHYPGMGRFGLHDAAGNVREWCYNAIEGEESVRSILGGACGDNEYQFASGETRSPWDRDLANGLRCAIYLGGKQAVPEQAFLPVQHKHRDFTRFKPVPDEVLDSYMNTWYKYDRTELNARVDRIDLDRNFCRRERITFDAAYPNERVIAYLHLPSGFKPPYQAVVWFPGAEAREDPWDEKAHKDEITAILQSGRAVIVPFYKGTYERRLEKPYYPPDGTLSRNLYVQDSQDMRRAIDYLETRKDIDAGKLAYVGLSWGAQMGPVMMAVEERFKTGILLLGGICACERHPTADPANFAPRVKVPTLMINAKEDSVFPYETAQKPLFELLGAPQPNKRHLLFPGGHSIPWEYHKQYYSEIVKWLDQYLGPAERIDKG